MIATSGNRPAKTYDRSRYLNTTLPKAFVSVAITLSSPSFLCAQGGEELPAYKSTSQVAGTIRVGGSHHQDVLMKYWEEDFSKLQPGVHFEDSLKSTATAIPALAFGLIDIGVMGRGILPLETLEFRREFRYAPTEVVIATGSYDVA